MMCGSCRQAGDAWWSHVHGVPYLSPKLRDIERLHKECEYPGSCTCQHAIGHYTNV